MARSMNLFLPWCRWDGAGRCRAEGRQGHFLAAGEEAGQGCCGRNGVAWFRVAGEAPAGLGCLKAACCPL